MTGNVTGSNTNWVGGLAGHIDGAGTLIRSYATGTISGANYVGGLLGGTGQAFYAYNSYFSGNSVTGNSERIGGLVGHVGHAADVRNSYVTASLIQGSLRVGGLVGYSEWSTNILSDSTGGYTPISPYSTASVNATGSDGTRTGAGGLVGWVSNGHANVTDAYMTGSYVRGAGNHVGGLVGYTSTVYNTWILRSYASGTTIKGPNFVGGLTGNMSGGAIVNSYFSGTITGPDGVASSLSTEYGGLAGYMAPGASLSNSFYNIDTSLIKDVKTVTPGGIYNTQYAEWAASSSALASRTIDIARYFTAPTGGYYTVSTVSDSAVQAAPGNDATVHSDFSNMLGFVQSSNTGAVNSTAVNPYKFKLANNIDMATATMPYMPYFGATEFKGNAYAVNNFSFNRPTSQTGFIGLVYKSTITDLLVNSVAYAGQTSTNYAVNARNYTGTAIGSIYDGVVTGSTATLAGGVNGLEFTGGFAGWAHGFRGCDHPQQQPGSQRHRPRGRGGRLPQQQLHQQQRCGDDQHSHHLACNRQRDGHRRKRRRFDRRVHRRHGSVVQLISHRQRHRVLAPSRWFGGLGQWHWLQRLAGHGGCDPNQWRTGGRLDR